MISNDTAIFSTMHIYMHAVQYRQYSAVQHSTAQRSTAQYSTVQYSTVQYHTYLLTFLRNTYSFTYLHTYIHTYLPTYIHTYIHSTYIEVCKYPHIKSDQDHLQSPLLSSIPRKLSLFNDPCFAPRCVTFETFVFPGTSWPCHCHPWVQKACWKSKSQRFADASVAIGTQSL